jgi:DNA-binding NtrC family response regulator
LIQVALQRARGQRGLAAELLGIYRGRLLRRMKALGMADAEDEEDKVEGRGNEGAAGDR